MKSALLSLVLLCAVPCAACVSEVVQSPTDLTRGSIIQARPDLVWMQAKRTLASSSRRQEVNEGERTVHAALGPARTVTVKVEPYDSSETRTILRVTASENGQDAPEVASAVQLSIERALLGR